MSFHRVKEVYRLEELEKIFVRYDQRKWSFKLMLGKTHFLYFSRLEMKVTKSSGGVPRLSYTGRDDRHFLPTGLYIIKTVSGTCLSHLSAFVSSGLSEPAGSVEKLPSILNCVFFPQSRGRWPTVKTPWRSSSLINSLRSPLMTCLLMLLLPFSMFPSPGCSMSLVSVPTICAGVDLSLLYPQCLPCWALLLGLGGRGDRPWFTDEDGPRETIQRWHHVLRTPELPALKPPQNYWISLAAT